MFKWVLGAIVGTTTVVFGAVFGINAKAVEKVEERNISSEQQIIGAVNEIRDKGTSNGERISTLEKAVENIDSNTANTNANVQILTDYIINNQ